MNMARTMIPKESGDIVAYIPRVTSIEGSPTKRCESQVPAAKRFGISSFSREFLDLAF